MNSHHIKESKHYEKNPASDFDYAQVRNCKTVLITVGFRGIHSDELVIVS